jgi:hypothetical protein
MALNVFGQTQNTSFENLYQFIDQKDYFKAKELYSTSKDKLLPIHQKFIEAFLDNAFGKLSESNEKIAELTQGQLAQFPDSLQIALYEI